MLKRLALALLLVGLLATQAVAFGRVQTIGTAGTAGAGTTADAFMTPTAGNTVLVIAGWASAAVSDTAIFQDITNTISCTTLPIAFNATVGFAMVVGYCTSNQVLGGSTNFRITLNAARPFFSIIVEEWTGITTPSPVDSSMFNMQNAPGTGTNAINTGTYTTSSSGDLLWGALVDTAGIGSNSAGTLSQAYTMLTQASGITAYYTEWAVQGGPSGSTEASFTSAAAGSGTSGNWYYTYGVAFKAAGGGGGPPHNIMMTGQ
jgi:hypothetical protein